jgi:hypothetical protein
LKKVNFLKKEFNIANCVNSPFSYLTIGGMKVSQRTKWLNFCDCIFDSLLYSATERFFQFLRISGKKLIFYRLNKISAQISQNGNCGGNSL